MFCFLSFKFNDVLLKHLDQRFSTIVLWYDDVPWEYTGYAFTIFRSNCINNWDKYQYFGIQSLVLCNVLQSEIECYIIWKFLPVCIIFIKMWDEIIKSTSSDKFYYFKVKQCFWKEKGYNINDCVRNRFVSRPVPEKLFLKKGQV